MNVTLMVIRPFGPYDIGERISSIEQIRAIQKSELSVNVVRVVAAPSAERKLSRKGD